MVGFDLTMQYNPHLWSCDQTQNACAVDTGACHGQSILSDIQHLTVHSQSWAEPTIQGNHEIQPYREWEGIVLTEMIVL